MLAAFHVAAQPASYDDVAVIMNVNSMDSQAITAAFQTARGIPQVNIIPVNVPESEQILPDVFQTLRAQIEQHMTNYGLVESINYIVTTKGVPLRIGTTTCETFFNFSGCTSVDSEFTLLFSPWADNILTGISTPNPFLASTSHHNRAVNGIYLVTRLDGFKVEDVLGLIERSGQDLPVDKQTAHFVADFHWPDADQGVPNVFNYQFGLVMAPMESAGWQTTINMSDTVTSPLTNVLGHVAVDFFPEVGTPVIGWSPGGLAIDWFSLPAYSFDPVFLDAGHVRLADRIAEGATGARGSVTLAFASVNVHAQHTFVRYTDTTLHFNLAESFYAGISELSYTDVVIGDPKTSIQVLPATSITEQEAPAGPLVMPNPSDGLFALQMPQGRARLVSITDATGRSVPHAPSAMRDRIEVDLQGHPDGIYLARLLDEQDRPLVVRLVLHR